MSVGGGGAVSSVRVLILEVKKKKKLVGWGWGFRIMACRYFLFGIFVETSEGNPPGIKLNKINPLPPPKCAARRCDPHPLRSVKLSASCI